MNKFEDVFEFLKKELIEWKPKDTTPDKSGIGFNDYNVKEILGTLPTTSVFDYVYVSPPVMASSGLTTGSRNVQRSTQTFTIDIYCKRGGTGNKMKEETFKALRENTDFISNLFASQGFIIGGSPADLNFQGSNTARQILNITRTFIEY